MEGVVNEVTPSPPDKTLPPLAFAYQSTVSPFATLAESVTVPVPLLLPDVPVGKDGILETDTTLVSVLHEPELTVYVIVAVPTPIASTIPFD